ncbi:MAG TPA: ribosome small subunit-dependent GTPase A [Acidimicrobiales bacterium]|nr:ribosome small subunit-dependent GTPase A [Acidimicrobiales bacterium]
MSHPLSAFGWDDRVAALFTLVDVGGDVAPGRVIRMDRGSCLVAVGGGTTRANPYALASRQAGVTDDPVTGDWVAVVDDSSEGTVVVAILPRHSTISRRDSNEDAVTEQVLAANVDIVAAVCPLDRPFAENRLERFLTMAWESGGMPAIILTKADAAETAEAAAATAETAAALAADIDVYLTSATRGIGLDDLRTLIAPGLTLVLIGQSGAGKSTLVNSLIGRDAQETKAVRKGDSRGRHTTTTRDLIPMPGGGVLLDTPGLRSLALWDAEAAVADTFPDIEALAAGCRFRDCRHEAEPDCAVRAAALDGTLERRRFESYRKLEKEIAALERQKDVRARREAGRTFGRSMREVQKFKKR